MRERFEQLLAYYGEIYDLGKAAALLSWDQQCHMPVGGSRARAEQMATLTRLIHARISSPALGELLDSVEPWARQQGEDSFEAAVVRVLSRRHRQQARVPAALAEALSRAASDGFRDWMEARRQRRFATFQEALERIVGLQRELADALGWEACRYDALLDLREPGITTAWLDRLFGRLRAELVPLVRAVTSRPEAVDDSILHQAWDEQRQWDLTLEAVRLVGYDLERGRQDRSVHPFTTSFSPDDVRITTRIDPNFFNPAFFASLHEAGHALYMQGVPAAFYRTPLDGGASGGVHESQSRMWENLVGRSRAFWEHFFPRLRQVFPAQVEGVDVEAWYRAVNRSQPSLIRVEADELTYNLHIMIRFELENALLDGQLPVAELPAAWREKMEGYLGVTPPDDLQGVLQDIHWSSIGFGSFPSYALGNVISVQLYQAALAEHPSMEDDFRRGDFSPLLDWTRRNIHAHGARYAPLDLVERATGAPLSAEPYLAYIRRKFGELYDV